MRKFLILVPLLIWIQPASARPLQKTPSLLMGAVHCLAVKEFLPHPEKKTHTFGYFLDMHSYPDQKVIYIVAYKAADLPNGWVFAVFLTETDRHPIFSIQNNAKFALSRREPLGVSFITPPLGGDWTQAHLISAIKEIEKQQRFIIQTESLLQQNSGLCESYTDQLPTGK